MAGLIGDAAAYQAVFQTECERSYSMLDAVEERLGFSIDRALLQDMARVLACPVKKNPPCWQHGRLIYAIARDYLVWSHDEQFWLDIGTAKGFSALCMALAMRDDGAHGSIVSLDVIVPEARVERNTVADLDGAKTISELVAPWIQESTGVEFFGVPSGKWLAANMRRINFAFVDGKHTYEAASADAAGIAKRQMPGDIIIFDDLQIAPVARAVKELKGYAVEEIEALPTRRYAVAVKC